jgi:hypothetical protein
MALIECPECRAQISDKAPTCIKCGAPVIKTAGYKPAAAAYVPEAPVVTTQQTSKKYKLGQIIGSVLVLGGVVSCSSNDMGASAVFFVVGGAVYFGSVFGAWWDHR